jgi:hypothetical protein
VAPPGTHILIHETPQQCHTWAAHGVDGWYLGPTPGHYRCYNGYATRTAAERTAANVESFPYNCPMPKTSSTDATIAAATALIQAISPIAIRNPIGAVVYSTHTTALDVPGLPPAASHVHIVPALDAQSLISMGPQLCRAGYTATFDAATVTEHCYNKIVLTGTCTSITRLWHLTLSHTLPNDS